MTKILIIEDEEPIRELINDILSLANFEVLEAKNGTEGIEMALSHHPDLILSDIMMPGKDGYQVLQELQRRKETEAIPFIFLTARGTKQDMRRGMNIGADDYLIKPFNEDELLQAVTTRLKKHAATIQEYMKQVENTRSEFNYVLHHDLLTGLPNQLSLREMFAQIVTDFKRSESIQEGMLVPIFCLGIDRFRRVNEILGYQIGDTMIKLAGERLVRCIGNRGKIARLSGDQFVLLLNPIKYKQSAIDIAQEILNAFVPPFIVKEQEIFLTVSIGIIFYPRDDEILEKLVEKACQAMMKVKKIGGNQCECYTIALQKQSIPDYLQLESDLRRALEQNQLEVYYQPRVSLKDGYIIGAEALTRWHHPLRGMVPPGIFIPIAEETGLIESIGEWVLRTACNQMKTLPTVNGKKLRIAVNISGRQFNNIRVANWLDAILLEDSLDGQLLDLELTESILVENVAVSIRKLNALKSLGVRIAIDDFGTGYSSLGYLQQFPFEILKIDRCFVKDIDQNSKNAAIAQSLISLAHQLNLTVVAEGVEREEELSFLRANDCDEMQGFFFGRPLPLSDFQALVKTGKKLPIS